MILIFIYFIFIGGECPKIETLDPKVVIPDCIGGTYRQWTARINVMNENWTRFDVLFNNGGVNPVYAFLKKGRINIQNCYYDTLTVIPYYIPKGATEINEMNYACEILSAQYRGASQNYVMGLDSFMYCPPNGNAGWSNGPNHQGNYSNWSFISSGYIQGYYGTNNSGKEVVEAVFTHEIGHQIAITDHGPHTGNDAANCLMGAPYDPEILKRFQFCDGHICEMYNQLYEYAKKSTRINNHFSCEINLDKEEYLEGESVWLIIKIKNESNKYDSLAYGVAEYLVGQRLKVMDENGKTSPYHGSYGHSLRIPYRYFKPHSDTTYYFEIMNNFGFEYENAYDYGAMISYFPAGKYTVQLVYDEAGIISNIVTFTVNKPDEIESARLQELRRIYNTKDRNERIVKYHNFIDSNLNSIYIPQTIWALNGCYSVLYLGGMPLDTMIIRQIKYFLNNYPNSYYVSSSVIRNIWIYEYEQSQSEFIAKESLIEIIRNYPGTYAAMQAYYCLGRSKYLKELVRKPKK